MIRELGTVRDIAYPSGEEEIVEIETADVETEPADVSELVIGSLLFDQSSLYSNAPKRRIRVRSSSVL